MKKINKIVHVLLMLIISFTIGLGFYSWNSKTLLGNKIPMPLGYGGSVVLSGSMEPTLSINDLIIIKETNDYKVDDVVVFETDSVVVVHRIVGYEGELIVTKGDANNVEDSPISEERIIGEVIFVIPGIGNIVTMIKSPIGMVSILTVSFLLLEMSYRKEKEEGQQSIDEIKEEIRRLKEEQEKNKQD